MRLVSVLQEDRRIIFCRPCDRALPGRHVTHVVSVVIRQGFPRLSFLRVFQGLLWEGHGKAMAACFIGFRPGFGGSAQQVFGGPGSDGVVQMFRL